MFIQQKVSMQGRYRLTSRDIATQEIVASSGWSDNKIIQTEESAKIIHETGFTSTPPFQVGRTDTGNYDTFENVIELTHTTRTIKNMSFGWVTPGDVTAGYKVEGGGSYKLLPNTSTRGLKVNQVGIKGFSIAQIKNENGIPMTYPITPNADVDIEFTLTIIVKPRSDTSIPTMDQSGARLFATACKINTAIDQAMINASGYEWTQLLTRPDSGLRAYTTVAGSITDPAVIGNLPPAPNRWEGLIGKVDVAVPGNYIRRGYVSSGISDLNYIRLGIPTGIPGVFTSIIFGALYTFPIRTLTDIVVTSTVT